MATFLARCFLFVFLWMLSLTLYSQTATHKKIWHDQERTIRYKPDREDFIIVNGTRRFNRALYGTHTGFRIEAGDLPEFALYMPGMGGNLRFGFLSNDTSKWIIDAQYIKARYRAGSMLYTIQDPMLGNDTLHITVLPAAKEEALLIKIKFTSTAPSDTKLVWAFGGATGKRFSRDGDIGADPESSFYLKPEYCTDNRFSVAQNIFTLHYGSGKPLTEKELQEIQRPPYHAVEPLPETKHKMLTGILPPQSDLKFGDAGKQKSPAILYSSAPSQTPVMCGKIKLSEEFFICIQNPSSQISPTVDYATLLKRFQDAEEARATLASHIQIKTPDPYLNTLGSALSMAADAIWEEPSYLHGAVAWRMRLNAWRGAYAADQLGWHDRAKKHFSSYAQSQVKTPETGPLVPDTALHFARHQEKIGTAMFSSGYICRNPGGDIRPHHYDMNLVFIDQLLTHFEWTGDTAYIRQMWPVLTRHLAWEKRNFDTDDDGLYDAYCCIWASDALQYSGGGVTHSSSYNYRAFKTTAQLATLIGEDPTPYQKEADKILRALNTTLWIPAKGCYAEYKDLLGNKLLHPAAALWTIYHAIDSRVPNRFQAYQSLRYIDTAVPHIPIVATGIPSGNHYTLSTSNWQPYTWSINNVALAEVLHTALAYWQGGRPKEAFTLWKSALLESMYLGASPGGFQQLSFYDAMRGELYRDFADPIGMASRSLIEGLFGIRPNALTDTLTVAPGFPATWNAASLKTPDIQLAYNRSANHDSYIITSAMPRLMSLNLIIPASKDGVRSVTVNGKKAPWKKLPEAIEVPRLAIPLAPAQHYDIVIAWKGKKIETFTSKPWYTTRQKIVTTFDTATIRDIYDPQHAFEDVQRNKHQIEANVTAAEGNKTVFIKLRQGVFQWWMPLHLEIRRPLEVIADTNTNIASFRIKNHTDAIISGSVKVHPHAQAISSFQVKANSTTDMITIPQQFNITGTHMVTLEWANQTDQQPLIHWKIKNTSTLHYRKINLSPLFNDRVINIFKNKYLSPRPTRPTLQLPWQGIGNWCYPLVQPEIDDAGLRQLAGPKNEIQIQNQIPFSTPSQPGEKNILFTSLWDNYPDSVVIPLSGKGKHAYFLMTGTTNPMQSRFDNGILTIRYNDDTKTQIVLRNPETWWPIEQDYFEDGYAFTIGDARPPRISLKYGTMINKNTPYTVIKAFSSTAIEGGAATVLDVPLDPAKTLKSITLRTLANDVVIGLMAMTIVEDK